MNWFLSLQEWFFFLKTHPTMWLWTSISSLVFLILLLYYCTQQIRSQVLVNWPVVGMLPALVANRHRLLDHMVVAFKESHHSRESTALFKGPWFCGMDLFLTCNPQNANHMFNTNFSNYPKGDEFSEIFDVLGDGIFNADGDSWMVQRNMAHAQIGDRRFRSSVGECTKDKVVEALLPLLNRMAEQDKVVDLSDVFMRLMCDTTCSLIVGVDPGCLAPEFPDATLAKSIENMQQVLLVRHIVPRIWWKLLRWLRAGEEKKMAESVEVVDHFIAQCIRDARRKINQGESDAKEGYANLLASYMNLSTADVGEDSKSIQINDKFLRDTVLTFLGAGKDTTTAALIWLFWLVSNNPDVEKKILQELRQLRPASMAKEMMIFDAEEIDSLVYLHATICETLRLYPPVPFNHKEPLKVDILPSGHEVRPGMKIIFSLYATGRMEGIWGKDCLEFKPERWITEKGTLKHEPSYKFIAFHSGPRSCLGKGMAFTQIKVVAAALIYNFSIRTIQGHVMKPKLNSIVIQASNCLLVKLKRREFCGC